jgi:hypothetical protein
VFNLPFAPSCAARSAAGGAGSWDVWRGGCGGPLILRAGIGQSAAGCRRLSTLGSENRLSDAAILRAGIGESAAVRFSDPQCGNTDHPSRGGTQRPVTPPTSEEAAFSGISDGVASDSWRESPVHGASSTARSVRPACRWRRRRSGATRARPGHPATRYTPGTRPAYARAATRCAAPAHRGPRARCATSGCTAPSRTPP